MLTEQSTAAEIKAFEDRIMAKIAAAQKAKAPKVVISRDEQRKANDRKIAQLKAKLAAHENGSLKLSKMEQGDLAHDLEAAWELAASF